MSGHEAQVIWEGGKSWGGVRALWADDDLPRGSLGYVVLKQCKQATPDPPGEETPDDIICLRPAEWTEMASAVTTWLKQREASE